MGKADKEVMFKENCSDEEIGAETNARINNKQEGEEVIHTKQLKSTDSVKKNKKKSDLIEAVRKRWVCYLSRIPRHMDHVRLRHILSDYGEIERIYLVPENPSSLVNRKRAGGYRGTEFSEGWVEFAKKTVAKKVARLLNGEQMGKHMKQKMEGAESDAEATDETPEPKIIRRFPQNQPVDKTNETKPGLS